VTAEVAVRAIASRSAASSGSLVLSAVSFPPCGGRISLGQAVLHVRRHRSRDSDEDAREPPVRATVHHQPASARHVDPAPPRPRIGMSADTAASGAGVGWTGARRPARPAYGAHSRW